MASDDSRVATARDISLDVMGIVLEEVRTLTLRLVERLDGLERLVGANRLAQLLAGDALHLAGSLAVLGLSISSRGDLGARRSPLVTELANDVDRQGDGSSRKAEGRERESFDHADAFSPTSIVSGSQSQRRRPSLVTCEQSVS